MRLFAAKTKGYLFALVATIAFSNVYIFSKAALNEVSMAQFWFYWFATGLTLNTLLCWINGSFNLLKKRKLQELRNFIILGILEIVTTLSFFFAIKTIPDPSVTSFIGNMYVVFLVTFGILLLKERFTLIESTGVLITIIGVFAVGFKGGRTLREMFIPGAGLVLINTFLAALTSIVAKKTIDRFNPMLVNFNRTLFLFLFAVGFMLLEGKTLSIPATALKNILIGSFLGPFLGILTIYFSYKYIEVSRSSVVQGLKGLFVLIGSFIYFGTLPGKLQMIGGILSVCGVLIMTLSKARLEIRRQNQKS